MRDNRLTEAMGDHWYDGKKVYRPSDGKEFTGPHERNRDFSTWQDFGYLWEWACEQVWWPPFIDSFYWIEASSGMEAILHHIHPDRFANAVDEYLQGRSQ